MNKAFYSQVLLVFLLTINFTLLSQPKQTAWQAGFSTIAGAGDQMPFWLISNREGKFYPDENAISAEIMLFSIKDTTRTIDYEYGLELYGRMGSSDDFWLHQAYAGIRLYDLVRVRAGWWTDIIGSREPSLSTGSIIWSGNTRPMPKIEIGTPGYVEIPYTHGFAEISGVLAHGWFVDDRFVDNVFLHHKNIYLKLGGALPVNVHYGFNHYGQWGGKSPNYELPFPSDLDAYYRIFFNRSGDTDIPGTPATWGNHKFGNTLGSRSHGIDLELQNIETGLYFQDVFEDGSGLRRKNFPDGLWGIWFRFNEEQRPLQAFTYEYLQTTDQSGRYHDLDGVVLGGDDNYFNHAIYQSGWSYHGYTIGTPFITSPILNDPPWHRFENTRVRVHHLGIKGHLAQSLSYRTLFSYSRNYGTYGRYSDPYDPPRDQFSWLLELSGPLNFFDLEASVSLAFDQGDMYGNNLGLMLRLVRKGSFSR